MSSQPALLIDDFGPLPVVQPQSVTELGDILRRAAAEGQAIYPLGGRTMLDYGLPPTRPGVAVDLTRLDQVIDYPARDMTITVQAGITIAKLQALLAAENQRLPIDVPRAEQATLGGALATNVSGPRRYGFGTLRDYVIGISVINDEGQEVKAGGRVVKNVAGYDLCKLHIGALGTLGIITQVTLKLRPLPEEQAYIVTGCMRDSLADLLRRLHASSTRPICIEAMSHTPLKCDFQVMVGLEGNRENVDWQVYRLQQELQPEYGCLDRRGADAERDARLLGEAADILGPWSVFKVNLVPSATAEFLGQALALPVNLYLHAHAGNGIVIGHVSDDLTLDSARTMLATLQDAAAKAHGNVVILKCPPAWKTSLPVWGQPRGDAWLMHQVKDKLDPRRLFNPGRFVDGI